MSVADLETELARWRGEATRGPSQAKRISVEEALEYRNAGNLPDDLGRSLRLVLVAEDTAAALHEKRLAWEPDFHDPPDWRRPGSVPVNVVPLRRSRASGAESDAWWDDPELASLEEEWSRTGAVAGLRIPAEYRGFVYKTIISLRAAGRPVTPESVVDSVARWLDPAQAAELRAALEGANG